MANQNDTDPKCDVHDGEDKVPAKVLCMKHHVFMCVNCLLNKKHSAKRCDVKEIDELSNLDVKKKDMVLLRNEIRRKRDNLNLHESNLDQKVRELKTGVNEVYEKLVSHLGTMRQSVFGSIDQQKHVIQQHLKKDTDALAPLEKTASENLQNLKESNMEKTDSIRKLMLDTVNNISERLTVTGTFFSPIMLEETILKMTRLGSVTLAEHDEEYEDIVENPYRFRDKTIRENRQSVVYNSKRTSTAEHNDLKPNGQPPSRQSEQYDFSDEYDPETKVQANRKSDNLSSTYPEPSTKPKLAVKPNVVPKSQQNNLLSSGQIKETDKVDSKGFQPCVQEILAKQTKAQIDTTDISNESDYAQTTFTNHALLINEAMVQQSDKPPEIPPKPKHLLPRGQITGKDKADSKNVRPFVREIQAKQAKPQNETNDNNNEGEYTSTTFQDLPINEAKLLHPLDGFTKPAYLSKIAFLRSEEMLVFLNSTQDEVILSDSFGNVSDRKICKTAIDLVTFGDQCVAVLHGLPLQITVYKLKVTKLTKESGVHLGIHLSQQEITGFVASPSSPEYVIICTDKVVYFNDLGTVQTTVPYKLGESDSNSDYNLPLILSTYDFFNQCVYTVKSSQNRKTYKCYNLAEQKMLWRRVCADEVFDPVAVSLLDDKLLILCKTAVMKINTMTGAGVKPVINITCLPGNALGFCALEDRKRIVVTTTALTLEKSLTIGYLSDE